MKPHTVLSRMTWRSWFFLGLISLGIVILAGGASAQEGQKNTAAEGSFESFEIIVNRNIFDPNRRSDRRKPSPEEEAARAANTSASSEEGNDNFHSEEMALVGTLIDGGTSVAFFTSENSDFKTVALLGETIGDFRLAEIRTEHVKLENNGKTIELPVGSRMSSQRDGGWTVAANPRPRLTPKNESEAAPSPKEEDSANPSTETTASSKSSTTPAATSTTGGGTDDVLKQLMEKRRKALEKK